jgi:2-keto-3-deoxy-6-phosphogluconate aldolase
MTAVDEASILIGPEGGLSEMEINQANQAGYRTLYFNPKKSHWGGKIMLLKLLGMLNCLTTVCLMR